MVPAMIMGPRLRPFALTAHVMFSVGWLGAVAVFLALAVIGLTSRDAQIVRGVYLVMEPAAWFVLIPLAFASLFTGIVQSLATAWGLFRHYWVLFKLVLNLAATIILVMYMATFRHMATTAADPTADLAAVRNPSPALHSVLALLVLLTATVLAIDKPGGPTPYGRRKLLERRARGQRTTIADVDAHDERDRDEVIGRAESGRESLAGPPWARYMLLALVAAILLLVVFHMAGGGMRLH